MKRLIILFFSIVLCLPSFADEKISIQKAKIVVSSNADGYVNVRKSSSVESEILCTLKNGKKVKVSVDGIEQEVWDKYAYFIGREGKWIEVQTVNGVKGYVHVSQVSIINDGSISKELSRKNKDYSALVLPVIILIIVLVLFLRFKHSRKCPHCGRNWAVHTIDEVYLGTTGKRTTYDDRGTRTTYESRVRETRQCKYCGYTFTRTVTKNG